MRWEDTQSRPAQIPLEPRVLYEESCRGYAHEPPCADYSAHRRRVRTERNAAGGEAQLKAKVGFWRRVEGKL